MYYFCTYFDRNYLYKGLALYYSLKQFDIKFKLWVLCLDNVTVEIIKKLALPEVETIRLENFESKYPELASAKQNRTVVEYYWTCTPKLILHLLELYSEINIVTYIDSDLLFFSDPKPAYDELGENSIYIVGHRFGTDIEKQEQIYGKFNVGFNIFRNNENSLSCLRWWYEKCLECCSIDANEGKVGDQKYLDEFPLRFEKVVETKLNGVGLGRWNFMHHSFKINNHVFQVDNERLIVFHFNTIDIINPYCLVASHVQKCPLLFQKYVKFIRKAICEVRKVDASFGYGYRKIPVKTWITSFLDGTLSFPYKLNHLL